MKSILAFLLIQSLELEFIDHKIIFSDILLLCHFYINFNYLKCCWYKYLQDLLFKVIHVMNIEHMSNTIVCPFGPFHLYHLPTPSGGTHYTPRVLCIVSD